jgi:hypothetical protein
MSDAQKAYNCFDKVVEGGKVEILDATEDSDSDSDSFTEKI